jgi:hypothetical protein
MEGKSLATPQNPSDELSQRQCRLCPINAGRCCTFILSFLFLKFSSGLVCKLFVLLVGILMGAYDTFDAAAALALCELPLAITPACALGTPVLPSASIAPLWPREQWTSSASSGNRPTFRLQTHSSSPQKRQSPAYIVAEKFSQVARL